MRRPRTPVGWFVLGLVAMVLIVAAALTAGRYGVLTPQGRLLIEARASGIRLGRIGKLKVEGLGGDIWRDFTVRRLTIADEKGVWLEADDLKVRWSYAKLFDRRLEIDAASARVVRVLRRPSLTAKGPPSRGLPVTFDVRSLHFRLETLPAFSTRPGLFDVAANLSIERHGLGQKGDVSAASLLHLGDRAFVQFDIGRTRPLLVAVNAMEAEGGAIAGALGLPAHQSFRVDARASGSERAGRLDAEVWSGGRRPAWAHGGWTSEGGVASGRVALAASTLTARYTRMIGPEAVFAVAARRARGGGYGAAARLRASNLALVAEGPVDPAKLSSAQGVKLALVVNDLSRIVSSPKAGAARAQGVLRGDPMAWRFAGTAAVERAGFGSYQLASVSGPVIVTGKGKETSVLATLVGAGGRGAGVVGGLAGASPHAKLDLVRLADGRLLIRKADASGAGFQLQASGGQGLLGALNFKGDARFTNLAMARPGASGAVTLKWSAAQASAARPWLFTADGQGERLVTGLGELDRLLGPSPRLKLQAALAGGVIAVANVAIDGAKAGATAQGKVDTRGPIALQTTWQAEGPFQAGPVQIGGKASGDGAVTGTLSEPRADLTADFAAIDIPRLPLKATHVVLSFIKHPAGFEGAIAVNGDSEYGPARAKSAFRFVPDGLDLTGIDADAGGVKASGALSLRGSLPTTADLQLAIGPGAVLTQGSVTGTVKLIDTGAASGAFDLQARNASFRDSFVVIQNARLTGQGPLSRLPFQVTGDAATPQGPASLKGSGVYMQVGEVRQIAIDGSGQFRRVAFNTLEPITVRLEGHDRSARLRVTLGGGRLDLDAHDIDGAFAARALLKGVDLKTLNQDFTGAFDADVSLQGRGPTLTGDMTARLENARSIDAKADTAINGDVKASLRGDRLTLDAQASGAGGLKSSLNVVLPVEASARPIRVAIVKTRAMQGRFLADGEVKPLWDLFYGGDRELGGQVHLDGTLGGTINDPQITGDAAVAGGRFQDSETGLVLTGLTTHAVLKRDVVTISDFSAKDEKSGAISGSGTISLVRGGASNLKLDLKGFRLIDNETAEATASGQVTFTRAADGHVQIAGALDLDRAQINAETKLRPSVVSMDVVERNRPGQLATLQPEPPRRGPSMALDITLRAPKRVFIRGRGIDAELSVRAHVTGTVASPSLSGTADIVQGRYDFAGKRFEFDERGSITLANEAENIRLDLSATWDGPSLTATVQIKGTAAKPEITLTSSPSLPQEEILAQVLFGASASQLSGAQTAELASTVTSLATGGGFDVLGGLRQFAGLDRLALAGDQTSGMAVAGGKYISDNVYLEVVGGGRQGPSAEVDWRIKRGISIISQVGGEFGAKLSVRWTRDLGRATGRRKLVGTAPPTGH